MLVSDQTINITHQRAGRFLDVVSRSRDGESVLTGMSLSAMGKKGEVSQGMNRVLGLWNVSLVHPSPAGVTELMALSAAGLQEHAMSGESPDPRAGRMLKFISSRMGEQDVQKGVVRGASMERGVAAGKTSASGLEG